MSVPVKLRASAEYDRPLFHPGQVLSDAELTRLGECARALLAAETRRHGWGIVRGFQPCIGENTATITTGRGMVSDQKGQLFELLEPESSNVGKLLDVSGQAAIPEGTGQDFDLWLVIDKDQFGAPAANLKIASEAGYAPTIEKDSRPDSRAVREAVTAKLELRPTSNFEALKAQQTKTFDAFQGEFNASGVDIQELQHVRLKALANAAAPPEFDGVPLGRVKIAKEGNSIVVKEIDRSTGRREEAKDELPALPHHFNLAPLFDRTRDEALAWLSHRGIQRWTIEELDDEHLELKQKKNPAFLDWRLNLGAGRTVSLYIHNSRILLAEAGPVIAEEIFELQRNLAKVQEEQRRQSVTILALFLLGIVVTTVLLGLLVRK